MRGYDQPVGLGVVRGITGVRQLLYVGQGEVFKRPTSRKRLTLIRGCVICMINLFWLRSVKTRC